MLRAAFSKRRMHRRSRRWRRQLGSLVGPAATASLVLKIRGAGVQCTAPPVGGHGGHPPFSVGVEKNKSRQRGGHFLAHHDLPGRSPTATSRLGRRSYSEPLQLVMIPLIAADRSTTGSGWTADRQRWRSAPSKRDGLGVGGTAVRWSTAR